MKQLQGEFSKTKRNPQIVAELMKKTFPQWRAEILDQTPSLPKLFELHPFLQEVDHVSGVISVGVIYKLNACNAAAYPRVGVDIRL